MELLKTLYWIHSPSDHEHGLQGFIRSYLYRHEIDFKVDSLGQTYNFSNSGSPLLVAHADQVSFLPITKITETDDRIYGDSNLGADDKNGIWILLHLLVEYPNLNFCFSNNEEQGGDIQNLLSENSESLLDMPYALVFDRKDKGDIIGYRNQYCSKIFEDEIVHLGSDFGYKSATGTWSDCDSLNRYLNCVNLSCGYYKAHTKEEYTVKTDLIKALEFGRSLIEGLEGKVFIVEDAEPYTSYESYDPWFDSCDICHSELIETQDGWTCQSCGFVLDEHWEV